MLQTETFDTISDFRPLPSGQDQDVGSARLYGIDPLTPNLVIVPYDGEPPAWFQRLMPSDNVLFAPGLDARIKVRVPFSVRLEAAEGGAVANAKDIGEFGFGANRGEALDDLARTISELYFSLDADRHRLSADLSSTLRVLEAHIVRTRQ